MVVKVRTPELVAEAKRLRAEGFSWAAIGNKLGVSETSAHEWGEEGYRKRAAMRHSYKTLLRHNVTRKADRPDDASLPPLPRDTRDNTGRLCGDPLFDRSALAAKLAEQT